MKTLAVYITPPEGDPFYRFAKKLLGYDLWSQENTPHPVFSGSVGGAANFGFHCTVGDALRFREEDVEEIKARLSRICSQTNPFILSNFYLNHEFWAGVPVLVSEFSELSGELFKLAGLVTTTINPLYVESPYYPKLLQFLPQYREDYFQTYGAPQVLENYTPHFTLASSIPDRTARDRLVSYVESEFFAQNINYEQTVDQLHLVCQRPDSFYEVIATYILGTGEAV